MSITLAITDNEDGTGAVAAISGCGSGDAVSLYVSAFSGEVGGSDNWELAGQRTGPGNVTVSESVGCYFAYAVTSAGEITLVNYFVVTDQSSVSTIHNVSYQCLVAAQSRIRALSLPGIASTSVIVLKFAYDRMFRQNTSPVTLPCVMLYPKREIMDPSTGVTSKDDVIYPVYCTLAAADNQEPTMESGMERLLYWREKIARAFRNQRLPGVSSMIMGTVEPQDVVSPRPWMNNMLVSGILLKFKSREPRGLSA